MQKNNIYTKDLNKPIYGIKQPKNRLRKKNQLELIKLSNLKSII